MNGKKLFDIVFQNKEIKLRWFQLRINTRIICTNITLFAMRLKNNDLCTFCNEERETIEHLFADCELVLQFMALVKEQLVNHNIVNNDFDINNQLLIFGFCKDKKKTTDEALFYFFQVVKYFIYKSRCEETLPFLNVFKRYFLKKYETIRYIATKNNDLDKFQETWSLWETFIND